MLSAAGVLAVNIPVGEHVTRKVGGFDSQHRHHLDDVPWPSPSSSVSGSGCVTR